MHKAIIVTDTQNDFVEGGNLPVPGGHATSKAIAEHLGKTLDSGYYRIVVATQDWHVAPGDHFSETPDYVDTWPSHCVADSVGAQFEPHFERVVGERLAPEINNTFFIFQKGMLNAAYSGFEGLPLLRGPNNLTTLSGLFQKMGVSKVDVVGIEWRNCVKATALDSAKFGFETTVLEDLCAKLPGDDLIESARQEMLDAGVIVTTVEERQAAWLAKYEAEKLAEQSAEASADPR